MVSIEPRVVLTGSNRGIGLEFVRRYLEQDARIVATARDPHEANELNQLAARNSARLTVVGCDVTDPAQSAELARVVPWDGIDVLLNNAGTFGSDSPTLASVDFDTLAETLAVNTIGPLRVTQALWPMLERARGTICYVTSLMGSIADSSGGRYDYRISKCALNMVAHCVGHDCRERGMTAFAIHPGWVRTRMGGPAAPLSVEESVAAMIDTIARVTPDHNGAFLDRNGQLLPY